MLGAIHGDKARSIFEFSQLKEIKSIDPKVLINKKFFYSDDIIETIAIMDAIINNKEYGETLREYILKYENYRPDFEPYFKTSFSSKTIKWVKGIGRSDSIGNIAMMRISPVGYLFNNENEIIENAKLVTKTSHDSEEAFNSATIIALMIYYFRNGLTREEIFKKLKLCVEYKPFIKFNYTYYDIIGNCLFAIYNSNSFEDAIRKVLLMNVDTEANVRIVESVAEAMYGMNEKEKSDAIFNLPDDYVKIIKKAYK